jgi:hypothetical protein
MKLSDRTMQVLKNMSQINSSILIRPGNKIETIAPTSKILAKAEVEETFEQEFGIYDLARFLSALSLFKEPELLFDTNYVTVASEGRRLNYTFARPETIVAPPLKPIVFPSEDVKFNLSAKTLSEVIKAAGVLGIPEVVVVGDGAKVTVGAADPKNPTAHGFSVDVGESDKVFKMVFKVETFKFMPADYDVTISFKKIARFKAPGLAEYMVAAEDSSSVG